MATTRSILSAAKAVTAGRPTPGPQLGQLDVAGGYASAYGNFLPRPPQTFTDGAFGPFSPILPVPVDSPEQSGRPEPRREQYQVGWNLPVGEPGTEGLKLATFSTLRTLADLYSVARACIQLRKAEVRSLEWDVMPTADAAKANKGDVAWFRDFGERRAKAMRFFRRPDPDFFSWSSFLDALLEEVFVFDALSLYVRPKRGKGMGKGLLGSDLDCLELLSGPTIRPLYAIDGSYPRPPAPAYEQYLYGVPRSDFMQLVTGRDIEEAGLSDKLWGQFRGDQLLYLPMVPRRWTPYGFPPVERALIPIMSGLQKQGWALDWFREGTVPAIYMSPGDESMTPNQIRELQDALNAFAGDPAWHHKIIVLPPKSSVMPQRDAQLADQFDEIVMNQVCMAFDVMPMELGISPKVSTTVSPGASNQMAKMAQSTSERKGTKPLLMFLCDIMNTVLQVICGQDDMEFVFEGLQEEQDQVQLTELLIQQVTNGLRSVDEARDELNLQPWGVPETAGPVFLAQTGPVPFDLAVRQALTAATTPQPTQPAEPSQEKPGEPAPKPGEPKPATGAKPGEKPAKPAPGKQPAKPGTQASDIGDTPGHASAEETDAEAGQPRSAAGSPGATAGDKPGKLAPPHGATEGAAEEGGASQKLVITVGLAKAVNAELEALARHLRKGRQASTWTPRHVPAVTLARVNEYLAKGVSVDQAVETARALTLAFLTDDDVGDQAPKARAGTWPGRARAGQLAAAYAPRVQRALEDAVGAVARRRKPSRDATKRAVITALRPVLRDLWREAFYLGDHSGAMIMARAATKVDGWGTWTPGDPATADLGDALDAFQERLWLGDQALDGIGEANVDRAIAAARAAMAAELPVSNLLTQLRAILADPSRADLIARTETARFVSAGSLARYLAGGISQVIWVTGGVDDCEVCTTNENDGPTRIGDAFSSGLQWPPQHPDCQCVVLPAPGQPGATKATRRVVDLAGQESWVDAPAGGGSAAGGGAPMMPRADGSVQVGNEGTDAWPAGGPGTGQAEGGAVPGDANDRGRPPGPTGKRQRVSPESVDYRATGSITRRCGTCVMFQPPHGCDLVIGRVDADHVCDRWLARDAAKGQGPVAAGLAVIAGDTGRVLMLQRANDPTDPAAGAWEFPGGVLEDEDPFSGASREWQEETGLALPMGQRAGGWTSRDGVYAGFVYRVSAEADVAIHGDRAQVTNPDDPDGDATEELSWRDPATLGDDPTLRVELRADLDLVQAALTASVAKANGLPPFPTVVDPAEVRAVMEHNFPPEALSWVDDARWTGPWPVPLRLVDLDNVDSWAAHHERERVGHFERELTDRDPTNDPRPVILVSRPGRPVPFIVVDGHHRVLAARAAGQPVTAYVGTLPTDVGPWDETHSFQRHQGDDPGNG